LDIEAKEAGEDEDREKEAEFFDKVIEEQERVERATQETSTKKKALGGWRGWNIAQKKIADKWLRLGRGQYDWTSEKGKRTEEEKKRKGRCLGVERMKILRDKGRRKEILTNGGIRGPEGYAWTVDDERTIWGLFRSIRASKGDSIKAITKKGNMLWIGNAYEGGAKKRKEIKLREGGFLSTRSGFISSKKNLPFVTEPLFGEEMVEILTICDRIPKNGIKKFWADLANSLGKEEIIIGKQLSPVSMELKVTQGILENLKSVRRKRWASHTSENKRVKNGADFPHGLFQPVVEENIWIGFANKREFEEWAWATRKPGQVFEIRDAMMELCGPGQITTPSWKLIERLSVLKVEIVPTVSRVRGKIETEGPGFRVVPGDTEAHYELAARATGIIRDEVLVKIAVADTELGNWVMRGKGVPGKGKWCVLERACVSGRPFDEIGDTCPYTDGRGHDSRKKEQLTWAVKDGGIGRDILGERIARELRKRTKCPQVVDELAWLGKPSKPRGSGPPQTYANKVRGGDNKIPSEHPGETYAKVAEKGRKGGEEGTKPLAKEVKKKGTQGDRSGPGKGKGGETDGLPQREWEVKRRRGDRKDGPRGREGIKN